MIEENKAILRGKYDAAKALGGQVVAAKQDIAGLKARLEQRRMQRAAAGVAAGVPEADVLQQEDAEEERCRQGMEQVGLLHRPAVLACLLHLGCQTTLPALHSQQHLLLVVRLQHLCMCMSKVLCWSVA